MVSAAMLACVGFQNYATCLFYSFLTLPQTFPIEGGHRPWVVVETYGAGVIPLHDVIDNFEMEGRKLPDHDVGPVFVVDSDPCDVLANLLLSKAGAASRAVGADGADDWNTQHCRYEFICL